MQIKFPILFLSALSLLPAPAAARHWGNVDGWFVTSGQNSCGLYSEKKGRGNTEFMLLKRLDGALYIQAKNPAWNIKSGTEGQIRYQVDGRTYNGLQKTIALAEAPGRGILGALGSDMEQQIRAGMNLAIVNGGVLIDQLSLKGTQAALATVDSCLADLRANPPKPAAPAITVRAKPKNDPARWVGFRDYNKLGKREGGSGMVGFRLQIGVKGRVKGCEISRSSGYDDIDKATCKAVSKRARFHPAKNSKGQSVPDSYSSRVRLQLP